MTTTAPEHASSTAGGDPRAHGSARADAFPAFLADEIRAAYGAAVLERIVEGSAAPRTTTFRTNPLRADRADTLAELDQAGIAHVGHPWFADAFSAPGAAADAFWRLGCYEQGAIYLQSLSSMLPPLVLDARPGDDVLDMCAAPGGKTSEICAVAGGHVQVTACEKNNVRADKLAFNLRKQGCETVTVMRQDARRLDEFFRFDRILVDAPCSGSGTLLLGNAKQLGHVTPQLVARCAKTQSQLLDRALSMLKPGGTLVYSTCSVLPRENEQQVQGALSRARRRGTFEVAPVELAESDEFPRLEPRLDGTLLLAPTQEFEGFFVAKIVRKA
ncbi:MAG: RsmB/NOP family class I SAM-dependent RNA methyltransferase [Eggerthellaceae bacterium]|jgi:16S rRNA C967 or C1407 C5-methylase (RsmB/RsmF family)